MSRIPHRLFSSRTCTEGCFGPSWQMAHPGGSSDEFRVPGGLPSLIHTLQSQAAAAATVNNVKFEVRLNTRVAQLLATEATEDSTAAAAAASNNHTVRLALTGAEEEEGRSIDADMVLLAMPTRLAATSIEWQPALPGALASAMRLQNTWMGGMGKVAFVYDKPWCDTIAAVLCSQGSGSRVQWGFGCSGIFTWRKEPSRRKPCGWLETRCEQC